MNSQDLSRRSFIKKSAVATVATPKLPLVSGLAFAMDSSGAVWQECKTYTIVGGVCKSFNDGGNQTCDVTCDNDPAVYEAHCYFDTGNNKIFQVNCKLP